VLAGIPVNLITGRDAALKSRLLERLIALRPAAARWAVLLNEAGAAAATTVTANPGLFFSEVAQGCICCTAQLPLRVALTRLLRETAPDRLLILAAGGARTTEILRLLSDRWLSPVLSLRASIHVLAMADLPALSGDDTQAGQLAAAQVVAIDEGSAGEAVYAAAVRRLSASGNTPLIRRLRSGAIDLALLDLPGVVLAPRFRSMQSAPGSQQGQN